MKKALLSVLISSLMALSIVGGLSCQARDQARKEVPRTELQAGAVWKEPVTGMEFVWIPAGGFMMGLKGGFGDEEFVHKVHVNGFWLGKYEVTQGQWKTVMHDNPAYYRKGRRYPIELVDWGKTFDFIAKLNDRSALHLRLPTEAEWEYACKAGTEGPLYGELGEIAWYDANSGGATHPVGKKKPNAWGLYDMLGNVWEWCQVWSGYYDARPANARPAEGEFLIARGGGWGDGSNAVRASIRYKLGKTSVGAGLGLRLARD